MTSSDTISHQQQKSEPNFKVIILIIIVAILLAAAAALALRFFLNRPDVPTGQSRVEINGQLIYIQADPLKELAFVDEQTAGGGGQGQGQQPPAGATNTPLPPAPTNTPIPITPTALPPPQNMYNFVNHTVAAGETLYSLSIRYGTTIEAMARFGVSGADLVVGNVIQIPVPNPGRCPGSATYIVRSGDTLSGISVKCGTTVDELKRLNGFGDTFSLNVTDVICVPPQPTVR